MPQEVFLEALCSFSKLDGQSECVKQDLSAKVGSNVPGRVVATVGCAVTIASLAYSTFVQQLVAYGTLPVDITGSVRSVPRVRELPWCECIFLGGDIYGKADNINTMI